MRRTGLLGMLTLAALTIALLSSTSASATVLCKTSSNPCTGGTYAQGTTVEMSLKSGTKYALTTTFGEITCSESSIKGEVSNAGGGRTAVTIALTSFSLGKCNCGAATLRNGSWSAELTEGGNGALTSSETYTTFECLAIHCTFETSSTSIGTLKGGEMASVTMEGTIPRVGGNSGSMCGSSAPLKAEYTITAPAPLYLEEPYVSTVLCKTATNPCSGGTYGKGTTVEASSSGKTVLDAPFGNVECESSIKGEVTSGEGAVVSGPVSSFSFTNCGGDTVNVLKKGSFTIEKTKEGNGTLKVEGYETTVIHLGVHCIYSGMMTFTLTGGETATLDATSSLARTGGNSGLFCGSSAPWTGSYKVKAPEPLYVEETSISSVLCKTASNPCSGGTYGKGTTVEASSSGKTVLDAPFGNVECESSIKGEVTNAGGVDALVSGPVSSFSFTNCGGDTVNVLKKGSFTIEKTKEGNGTLKVEGYETTVIHLGVHCIYSGTMTFTLTGGETATLDATSSLARTGGNSGLFCGSSAPWTGSYKVKAPEPLYVEGP